MNVHYFSFLLMLASLLPGADITVIGKLPVPPQFTADAARLPDHSLLWWECADKNAIDATVAAQIESQVRNGAGLLITAGSPFSVSICQLMAVLPSNGWTWSGNGTIDEMGSGQRLNDRLLLTVDPKFWPMGSGPFPMSKPAPTWPVAAADKGMHRLERYERKIGGFGKEPLLQAAGQHLWSRPLLNREWKIRARADDAAQTPILVTGRYGAGHVAMLGISLSSLEAPAAADLRTSLLQWLINDEPAPSAEVKISKLEIALNPKQTSVVVKITCESPIINGELVIRLYDAQGAWVTDLNQRINTPEMTYTFTLPPPSPVTPLAYTQLPQIMARVGVISSDGRTLLKETEIHLDRSPALNLQVTTTLATAATHPFPDSPGAWREPASIFNRAIGAPIMSYTAAPGSQVPLSVTMSNGVKNIAPTAMITEQNDPQNLSLSGLNDGAYVSEMNGADGIAAYPTYSIKPGNDAQVLLTWNALVRPTAVVLCGAAWKERGAADRNPRSIRIFSGERELAVRLDLTADFLTGRGRVRIQLPADVSTLALRCVLGASMWPRNDTRVAELEVEAIVGNSEAISGELIVDALDPLGGITTRLHTEKVMLPAGSRMEKSLILSVPSGDALTPLRIEARLNGVTASTEVLGIQPTKPMTPVSKVSINDVGGQNVTRGYRSFNGIGTGTREEPGGWSTPDDHVWAYSRMLKQHGQGSRTQARRLWVTADDLRHYAMPWRTFPNGERFFTVGVPGWIDIIKKRQPKNWNNGDTIFSFFTDRWDGRPNMGQGWNWVDLLAFDRWLEKEGRPRLKPGSREEIVAQIVASRRSDWYRFWFDSYKDDATALEDGFKAEGKKIRISNQGIPLLPTGSRKPFVDIFQAMSDDCTFGMLGDNAPLTTGRNLATLAINPFWRLNTLAPWGYESSTLHNFIWHVATGTTEPSRRQLYDRAWRAVVDPDAGYRSIHTYGFGVNSAVGLTMDPLDWQQFSNALERHTLISPDAPLGCALVMSTALYNRDQRFAWSSGMDHEPHLDDDPLRALAFFTKTFRQLHEAGFPISCVANAADLRHIPTGTPIIFINPTDCDDKEITALLAEITAGRPIFMVGTVGIEGGTALAPALTSAFPAVIGQPIVQRGSAWLRRGPIASATVADLREIHKAMSGVIPIILPDGISGYGFSMRNDQFVVVEDWREIGRTIQLRVKIDRQATSAIAIGLNDHRPLEVHREGSWWVIDVPLRPADAELVCIRQK